jgi:uncharacterized protein involved in exopolysaccharide biosynthesis
MDPDAPEAEPDIRDTRRKWLALASVVAAVGMTGVWAYRLRQIYQKEFDRLVEVAKEKQAKATKLGDEVHAREATQPWPKL